MKGIYKLTALLFILCFTRLFSQTYQDPKSIDVYTAPSNITIDGILNEEGWNLNTTHLIFGPNAPTDAYAKSVTGGLKVGTNPTDLGPYIDTTYTTVKFLHKGAKLYIAFYSNDQSVCKFGQSWEGDGLFMKIMDKSGALKEVKFYFNDPTLDHAMVWDQGSFYGAGASVKGSKTVVEDTSQVDNGYTAECVINLDSLGYDANVDTIKVSMVIFDPDHYAVGQPEYNNVGTFYKTWWGSEWGDVLRSLVLKSQVLPVELTSFSANVNKDGVRLNWSTATELNNSNFEIQRSKDNLKFATIASIKGKGTTSNQSSYSYLDNSVNGKVYYRLKQVDFNGGFTYSKTVEVNAIVNPNNFELSQNYPNPFNPTTTINFTLPEKSNVTLKVFNVLGKEVGTLINGSLEAGQHAVNFDASKLSSGVYYYSIQAGNFTSTKKMILMK